VGCYWQVSNDYHAYVPVFEKHRGVLAREPYNPYETDVRPYPMINGPIEAWISDLMMFMDEGPVPAMSDSFFRKVAGPMWNAWFEWKEGDGPRRVDRALQQLESCK